MPNTWKRIIFGVEIDQAPAISTFGFECRVKAVRVAGDREALLFQKVTDSIMSSVLLVGCLGMGPDLLTV